jgi:hypothetical protein
VVIVEGRTDRPYFKRLGEALPPSSSVAVAERGDLGGLLAQVDLSPDQSQSGPGPG